MNEIDLEKCKLIEELTVKAAELEDQLHREKDVHQRTMGDVIRINGFLVARVKEVEELQTRLRTAQADLRMAMHLKPELERTQAQVSQLEDQLRREREASLQLREEMKMSDLLVHKQIDQLEAEVERLKYYEQVYIDAVKEMVNHYVNTRPPVTPKENHEN